ncbi:MAG: TM0106 family RecB-like putative nuclease [Desulfobacterales bacterium]|nr:MAG: TM0106 family RecB-like putative nuclease [Desulfobacterales bacterium]
MTPHITAAKLYDYTQCPHRVWRDIYGPQDEKIKETNPFVQLLWERGIAHEEQVVSNLGEFLNLQPGPYEDRFKQTISAMKEKTSLIYQGVLIYENMVGIPDLLKLLPDGQYVPIEIKSGRGFEGVDEEEGDPGRLKKHYAVQIALYSELLNKLGFENRRLGRVIDIRTEEVEYNLNRSLGRRDSRTLWQHYEQVKNDVELLITGEVRNKPALVGICKLCPWYLSCKKWVDESGDLTKIFYLGRNRRDRINKDLGIEKITDILCVDIKEVMRAKDRNREFLYGVGEKTLVEILRRAKVLVETKKPVAYANFQFPRVGYELYFDIEDDPTQEFVYMHGVYIKGPDGEEYKDFTAVELTREAERQAWQDFWSFIRSLPPDDFAVYYYSHHEKTTYRRMQKIYPEVISEAELDSFFAHPYVIDLYDIVKKHTDWPLSSYSLKDLAQYLGFSWQDETPSGALSIQWFNEFIDTKDEKILQRLLTYNEDDCKATMVLKEGIENLIDTQD